MTNKSQKQAQESTTGKIGLKLKRNQMLFASRVNGRLFVGLSIMSVCNGKKLGAEENEPIHCRAVACRKNVELMTFEAFIFAASYEDAEALLRLKAKDEGLTITCFRVIEQE